MNNMILQARMEKANKRWDNYDKNADIPEKSEYVRCEPWKIKGDRWIRKYYYTCPVKELRNQELVNTFAVEFMTDTDELIFKDEINED